MPDHQVSQTSTTDGLPVSPSLAPALEAIHVPPQAQLIDGRVVFISMIAIGIGLVAALMSRVLVGLIGWVTNLAFFGRFSFSFTSPADNHLGGWVILIPVIGGIVVGLMARFGSEAIRGHGIPEAMERVLLGDSRIPARLTFLKPLSAAVAIGTGGPFGAEGPIIATGGAFGSVIGQAISTTAAERKTLLAAGAAAGMAATFGSPISAVILAVELLLFEFRPRSLVPVALASAAATSIRMTMEGTAPVFKMSAVIPPTELSLVVYLLIGALAGVAAVYVTRAVYAVEDAFEHLPIHWMWWPAVGALAVGVVGYFTPRTLGVGYSNISDILSDALSIKFVAILCIMKFISWVISLGSGTSGGTLAPLFTIGGGLGAVLGAGAHRLIPSVDPRLAALVGMAGLFAGASRALLASIVFAFETTLEPLGLLPLLGGCTCAYLVSCLLMRHTIMTEKLARRGVRVPAEYAADTLDHILVRHVASPRTVFLKAEETIGQARAWLDSGAEGSAHQGFPILDAHDALVGVVTRRNLLDSGVNLADPVRTLVRRPPVVVYENSTLREAMDHMLNHDVGRLPVMSRERPGHVVGVITRSDLLAAYRRRLAESHMQKPTVKMRVPKLRLSSTH